MATPSTANGKSSVGGDTMTLSCIVGWAGCAAAVAVVLFAVAIAVVPRLLYSDLPAGLSLDLDRPTTIIVTGANSGLGLASVMHFAHNEHATIIMACRSETRCAKAKQKIYDALGKKDSVVKAELKPMSLDLSKKESIEAFANELKGQPIHILINNAGMAGATPDLAYSSENGVETHIHVNHLGHVRLVHCLWKNLQMAEQARIVVVSSLMATPAKNVPTFGWYEGEPRYETHWNMRMYGGSKRANLMFANELHQRLKNNEGKISDNNNHISVVAAHPGFTHTDLCHNGCTGKNTFGRYVSNLKLLVGTVKMTAEDGSLSQAYAAVVPQSGIYIGPSLALVGEPKILGELDHSWHHMAFARDESKQLWDKSLKALGIQDFGNFGVSKNEVPLETEGMPSDEAEQTSDTEQGKDNTEAFNQEAAQE